MPAEAEVGPPSRSLPTSDSTTARWTKLLVPSAQDRLQDAAVDLRPGRFLLAVIDAGLAITVLVLVYRLLVGRIYFEIGEIDVSVWQFRNPCTILVLLYLGRRVLVAKLLRRVAPELPRTAQPGPGAPASLQIIPASLAPGRLLMIVVGLLSSVLLTFNSSTQDIERYWSRAGEILTSEHSESFGPEYRSFMMFIDRCQQLIPESDSIYLNTDQRPFHLNYYLLPRRVYLPLDIQKSLDLRNTYGDASAPLPALDETARAKFFQERNIGWIIDWYGARSSRNRIVRVPAPDR